MYLCPTIASCHMHTHLHLLGMYPPLGLRLNSPGNLIGDLCISIFFAVEVETWKHNMLRIIENLPRTAQLS